MNEPKPELQLVERVKAGSQQAFEQLYDQYSAALLGVAVRVLGGNQPVAEDVLQEAFVKIWKNIERFDSSKGTIFTWMLNITRNTAIDKLRNLNIQPIQSLNENVSSINVSENFAINTDVIGVEDAVNTLKPEYRQMIDLAYFGGYTQEEISEKLDIPLGTVKTRTRAALNQLRTIFK